MRSVFRVDSLTLKKLINKFIHVILVIAAIVTIGMMSSTLIAKVKENFTTANRAWGVFEYIKEGRLNPRREALNRKGVEVFKKNYLLGIGFGNFRDFYSGRYMEIHNTYISLLAETGLIGFGGYIILIGFILFSLSIINVDPIRKIVFINFFIGYLLVNLSHYLLRERWVWLYFLAIIAISTINKKIEPNKLAA
jgi:O-antigen ligase